MMSVMERRSGNAAAAALALALAMVVVLVLANGVHAQIYTCLGGCYNECVLRSKKSVQETLGCYLQCLPSCKPQSSPAYRYYCQIGCSLGQCNALRTDGTRMEKCLGRCSNICKF